MHTCGSLNTIPISVSNPFKHVVISSFLSSTWTERLTVSFVCLAVIANLSVFSLSPSSWLTKGAPYRYSLAVDTKAYSNADNYFTRCLINGGHYCCSLQKYADFITVK